MDCLLFSVFCVIIKRKFRRGNDLTGGRMIKVDLNDLDRFFRKGELIPAICYEVDTKTVLMLAYMNKESLRRTLETGYTWFWSRSRQ